MSFAQILTAYINLNVLVVASYLSLALYPILAGLAKKSICPKSLLKLHYAVLLILLLALLLYPFLPERRTFNPAVQIWSAESMDTFAKDYSPHDDEGYLGLPGVMEAESFNTDNAKQAVAGFIIFLLILGVLNLSNGLRKLFAIRKGSYLIRRCGLVSIYANDSIKVPFSYWLPGAANVIIPTDLVGNMPDYKITIFHELQHHRNGDTKWVYFVWFLRSICIFNPCIHLWRRLISELQEFACDAVLVGRKKIDSRAYACCLYEVAKSASGRRCTIPLCATGLIFMVERKLLKRRIERMFGKLPDQLKWQTNLSVAILIVGLMASISFASKGVVQDRRITEAQATAMAERAGKDSSYPVVVNDLVLKELNAYLGTPEGREYIGASLERMKDYQKGIEEKIKEYGLPLEFLAIPLVESGYQNLEQKKWGAGLWMFIQSTARAFGLTVNENVDERLDVDILNDAAMRYLLSNKLRFNDWQLSVLAYSIGEKNVQRTINETGSRDVWDVARAFYNSRLDKTSSGKETNYYARFMAAVIIMKNPDAAGQLAPFSILS